MDPEENYDLTEALVGRDHGSYPADISTGSTNQNTSATRCSGRIRDLPTLFFIVTPMIIFIIVVFVSAALLPIDSTSNSSKQASSLRDSMIQYLARNIPPYDVSNIATLGFQSSGQSKVDGLSDGIVNQTVFYSIQAMTLYPWTDSIPQDVYFEYVTPYSVTNEPRTDHRPLFFDVLKDTLKQYERAAIGNNTHSSQEQIKEVVQLINTRLWALMARDSTKPIVFKASQTPRIYDPLSVIAYGYSSCTGLAIMLVSALRSVGIPARMAGTPAWYGDPSKGDHSWVEVYVVNNEAGKAGEWIFLEPTPGIAEGNEDTANADNLDRDPCQRWFCKADRFNGSTKVYATRYDKLATSFFPMAWADNDEGVPGVDRSNFYTSTCGKCK